MTGRELPPTSAFAGDDGSADAGVAAALDGFAAGTATVAHVVAALAGTRVLVPVVAELDSTGTVEVGGQVHTVEKEASTGIVALQAPDGRTALPVFSSVSAMTAWRRDARPVPSEIARAALSAVDEGWELVVLDPGGPVTVLVPRPAVWALARQQVWRPAVGDDGSGPRVDPEVRAAVRSAVRSAVGGRTPAGARSSGPDGSVPGVRGATEARDARTAQDGIETADATPDTRVERRGGPWWRRRSATGAADQDAVPTATPVPLPTATPAPVPGATPVPGPVADVEALPGRRAEVAVEVTLVPGLDRAALDAVLRRIGEALAADETVTQRVDSLEVRVR